jgi:hypothetical protein
MSDADGYRDIKIEMRQADTGRIDCFCIRSRNSRNTDEQEQVASTCDFIVLLMPTNTMNCLRFDLSYPYLDITSRFPLPSATLSRLMVESHGHLRELEMAFIILEEEHLRLLATASPDLVMKLTFCTIPDAAGNAFIEWLQSNRGPTELYKCQINPTILATALRGNHHLKLLSFGDFYVDLDAELHAIAPGLAENLGLVELDVTTEDPPVSDGAWLSLFRSLRAHPTLTRLRLVEDGGRSTVTDEQKKSRASAIVDMLQVNTILSEIPFWWHEMDAQIYQDAIRPRLRENFYRSKLHAVREARGTLRAKLLCRALATVANYPELIHTLVAENREVVVETFIHQGRNYVSEARGTFHANLLGRPLATVANFPELVQALVAETRAFIRQGRN